MRSLWEGKNHPKNAASLLIFSVLFLKVKIFYAKNLGFIGQKAAKLPAIKLWEWFELAFHFFLSIGHTYDISNKHRLGYSEVQLVQTMIDGVNTLWKEDLELQKKHGM